MRRERATSSKLESLEKADESRGRHAEVALSGEPSPEQQAILRDLVAKLLARAPADDRVVLILREVEGLSAEEIAGILSLKTATVKVRLHRARKRMLEDYHRLRERS
jgi:RNA polymerase sigma-70 factor (ECF subfamily)